MSIVLDGSNVSTVGVPNSATAVASTSGTSIDFTGIPVGTKRITVMFNGVSTNGTSNLQVQIGNGAIVNTGYAASSVFSYTGSVSTSATSGFVVFFNAAAMAYSGTLTLNLVSGNTWVSSHCLSTVTVQLASITGGGVVSLSGTLDRVRITTTNGTDTFDAGSINILYE